MTVHRFRAMGCEVVVAGVAEESLREVEALFARREQIFSRFVAGSELNRVNAHAGRPTIVSSEFAAMLTLALDAAARTKGLVDPTLGRALEAAGYDRDFAALGDDARRPGPAAPSTLRRLRLYGRVVALPVGVKIDLNGVVKAQTVDDALGLVRADGFVSAGGDLAARGELSVSLPGGEPVWLGRGALATSGSDKRRWLLGGMPQHHLIDPRTGRPSRSPWEQVTVCGRTCLGADIAAKAAFLLGDAGPDWLDEHGMPGRFRTAEGRTLENASWRRSLREYACT